MNDDLFGDFKSRIVKPENIKPKFVSLPAGWPIPPKPMGTEQTAVWMNEQYQEFLKLKEVLQRKSFDDKSDEWKKSGLHPFDLAISIFQSTKALAAQASEAIVALGYEAAFGHITIPIKQHEPDTRVKTKTYDVMFEFRRAILLISVTTKPQERKDHVWKGEAEKAHDYFGRRLCEGSKTKYKEVIFVGLFFSGETAERAQAIVKSKQALFCGVNGKIVSVRDVEGHASFLQETTGKLN